MKKILLMLVWFVGFHFLSADAAITVTPATGGTNICANLALGGSTPGFTTLGTITITEGLNGDIAAGLHNVSINAPAGWQFNTGSIPTVTAAGGGDIAVFGTAISATALTFNVGNFGTANIDQITITGLQVRATSAGAAAGNVYAGAAPTMAGITTGPGGNNFGSLSLTPSLTPAVNIAGNPAGAICAGTTVTFTATPTNGGTPTYQWFLNGGSVPGATNTTFVGSALTNGNTIRVQMNATGCVAPTSASSNVITMTVNPVPAAVAVVTAGTYCNNTTLNASLAGAGTIYYQGTTFNGTSIATPATSQFIATPGTNTYYFRAQGAGGCWGPQGSAKVTINLQPSAIAIAPATTSTLCLGDSATFIASSTAPTVEILQEDFNAGLGAWTISNIAGVPNSYFQIRNPPGWLNAAAGDGTPYMEAAADAAGTGVNTTTRVISPSFSTLGFTTANVSFNQFYKAYNAGINRDFVVSVDYSTDGGFSWTTILDQAGTVASDATIGAAAWTTTTPNLTLAIPAPALDQPNVQLRWNYNSTYGWYWAIDNIVVSGLPTLTYSWVGVSGAAGLSCTTCDTVTITPMVAGVNVYTVSSTLSGCTTVAGLTITANPLPAIFDVTGGGSYCAGGTGVSVGLSGSEVGVDYQLYNGAATVGAAVTGTGLPLDFGLQTAAGTYSVVAGNTSTTCTQNMNDSAVVVIDPLPTIYNVTGSGAFCASDTGMHIGLDGSDTGITYQLFNGSVMEGSPVAGTGSALDFGLFSAAGTYTVNATNNITMCVADMAGSAVLTVNPLPTVYNVTGGGSYCAGDAGVSVGLDGSDAGINYQLYMGMSTVGAAMPGTGIALDFGLQTAAGTYTILATDGTTACTMDMNDSAVITINPLPSAITGSSVVCEGDTITLTNATPGGIWTSSDVLTATVDTATGEVVGIAGGVADISYALPTTCFVTQSVTVNPAPVVAPIMGVSVLCVGGSTTLTNDTTGGVWSSDDASIASIDPVTGMLNATGAGVTNINYTVSDGLGCAMTVTMSDTVVAFPVVDVITGPTDVCEGSTISLMNATAGGVWNSSDPAIGAIDTATGVLTGVMAGTVTVSYTVTDYPGCATTVTVDETVNALPVIDPIAGADNVCAGLSTMLSSTTPGGVWSSSDATTAMVSSTGNVTGIMVGAVTITYTVTTGAGCTDFATHAMTVGNTMPPITILPIGSSVTLCGGNPVNLVSSTASGLTYQWSMGGMAIAGATDGSYTAATAGIYTLEIDNGTCSTVLPSKTVIDAPVAVINYNMSGNLLYTGAFATYQWFRDGTAIPGATSGMVSSPLPGDYIVVVTDVNGCIDTSDVYTLAPAGIDINTSDFAVRVYPNPASSTVYIDAPANVTVSVIAPDGRAVISNSTAKSIDVRELANGIYLIQIYDEHKTLLKTEKFLKVD